MHRVAEFLMQLLFRWKKKMTNFCWRLMLRTRWLVWCVAGKTWLGMSSKILLSYYFFFTRLSSSVDNVQNRIAARYAKRGIFARLSTTILLGNFWLTKWGRIISTLFGNILCAKKGETAMTKQTTGTLQESVVTFLQISCQCWHHSWVNISRGQLARQRGSAYTSSRPTTNSNRGFCTVLLVWYGNTLHRLRLNWHSIRPCSST